MKIRYRMVAPTNVRRTHAEIQDAEPEARGCLMAERTAREILRAPEKAAERLNRCRLRLASISAACLSTTAHYDATGGGSHSKSGVGDGLAEFADAVNEVREAEKDLARSVGEAQDLLNTLKREHETFMDRDYELLRLRYVLRLPWNQVRAAMSHKNFRAATMRTLLNWHRHALDAAEDYMKEVPSNES